MPRPAILLFSGGIDSTTTLAIALQQGFSPVLLTFDYGQRHRIEIEKSRKVLTQFAGLKQIVFSIDLTQIGGSALTDAIEVPRNRAMTERSIPVTYVPARNLIFLSIAAAFGEVCHASDLFFGANVIDYSGYPDCRPEFIQQLETALNVGTKSGVQGRNFSIHAPLLMLTKREIIMKGLELGVDYTFTHSCYDPSDKGIACGHCDSCVIRLRAFEEAGLPDPASSQN